MLCPAFRSNEVEEEPLVIDKPELGVTPTVTVALDPPVFENERARLVV